MGSHYFFDTFDHHLASPPSAPVILFFIYRKQSLCLQVIPLRPPRTPRRGRRIRDGLRPLPPTSKRNHGLQLRSTLLDPRRVELSEEPRWVESSASRVENGTRHRFLGS